MLVGMEDLRSPQRLSIMRIFGTVVMVGAFMAVLGIGVYARLTGRLDAIGLVVFALLVVGGLVVSRVAGDIWALMFAALLVLASVGHL